MSASPSSPGEPHTEHVTHPVGQKKPNPWGLYDVAGNAGEWTSSDYTGIGYGTGPLIDPMPQIGTECIDIRGALANGWAQYARSGDRAFCGRTRAPLIGVRLVRTLD